MAVAPQCYPCEEETVDLLQTGFFLLRGSWRERRRHVGLRGKFHLGSVDDAEGELGVHEETVALVGVGGSERWVDGRFDGRSHGRFDGGSGGWLDGGS